MRPPVSVAIVDIALPDRDGIELCRGARRVLRERAAADLRSRRMTPTHETGS